MTLRHHTSSREDEVQPVVNRSFRLAFFSLFQSIDCQRDNPVSSFVDYALSETIELICAGKRTEDDTQRASNHDTHFSHVHPRRGKRKETVGYEYLQHQHARSKSLL